MCEEEFVGRLQKGNRVQVPVLIRWKNKLEPGEVLEVSICADYGDGSFYAKLGVDGRFIIPKIIRERIKAEPGDMLEVTLSPVK